MLQIIHKNETLEKIIMSRMCSAMSSLNAGSSLNMYAFHPNQFDCENFPGPQWNCLHTGMEIQKKLSSTNQLILLSSALCATLCIFIARSQNTGWSGFFRRSTDYCNLSSKGRHNAENSRLLTMLITNYNTSMLPLMGKSAIQQIVIILV